MPTGRNVSTFAVVEDEREMPKVDHFKLRFGPYATPRFRYGQTVTCLMRGKVKIIGLTDAPIPWPTCRDRIHASPILFGALARASRRESNQAVARAWGISGQTVTKWRKALGVRKTEGTTALRSEMVAHEPWAKHNRRKAWAKARDPERRAKISAALKGRQLPREAIERTRLANLGRKLSAETRRKMSLAHKNRKDRHPALGRLWTAEEDEMVRSLPPDEAARRANRSVAAVNDRWRALGLPDRRKTRAKKTP